MSSSLLSTTKAFWRKSLRPKDQPIFASEVTDMNSEQPEKPVTLLVVGAGSRGKVRSQFTVSISTA